MFHIYRLWQSVQIEHQHSTTLWHKGYVLYAFNIYIFPGSTKPSTQSNYLNSAHHLIDVISIFHPNTEEGETG